MRLPNSRVGFAQNSTADSLFINTEAFSKPGNLNPLLSPKTSSSGRRKGPKTILLACGGAFAAVLLGVIVITIRNQDGSETVIKIQEGSTIELKTDPGSKVTIAQQNNDTKSTTSSDAVKQKDAANPAGTDELHLTPLEYAEERSVAEWVLSLGGTGQVRLADGKKRGLKSAVDDPALQFVVDWLNLEGKSIVDDDLRRLSNCKQLQYVELKGNRINGTGLRYLKNSSLLGLAGQIDSAGNTTLLQDEGVSNLADLPILQQLIVVKNNI